jgi:hypothetical protein
MLYPSAEATARDIHEAPVEIISEEARRISLGEEANSKSKKDAHRPVSRPNVILNDDEPERNSPSFPNRATL